MYVVGLWGHAYTEVVVGVTPLALYIVLHLQASVVPSSKFHEYCIPYTQELKWWVVRSNSTILCVWKGET